MTPKEQLYNEIVYWEKLGCPAMASVLAAAYSKKYPDDPLVYRDNLGDSTDNRPNLIPKSQPKSLAK